MVAMVVKNNMRQVGRNLRTVERQEMPKIMTQALNRTAANVRTQTSRTIAKESGLKVGAVRAAITVGKAHWQNLKARVVSIGRAKNLASFGARETRRGISARAYGKRRVYRGTFFAFARQVVFVRETAKRLPIRPVFGPSVPGVWRQAETQETIRKTIDTRWPINFGQAFRRRLGGKP